MTPTVVANSVDASNARLIANLQAIRRTTPMTEALLSSLNANRAWLPAIGRDGSPTRCRTLGDDLHWLGRTTMPRLRAEALADAFQAGAGNVLLYSIGQGQVARLLLDRLPPYQALFVIEPDADALRAALELHDFSADIEERRLLLFAGEQAWRWASDFLIENPGFLIPSRILSWPWFERDAITHVTTALTNLQADVGRRRAEPTGRSPAPGRFGLPTQGEKRLAILSNSAAPLSINLCRRLNAGARARGLKTCHFALDGPAWVQPSAVAQALTGFDPSSMIVVDAAAPALLAAAASANVTWVVTGVVSDHHSSWPDTRPPSRVVVLSKQKRDRVGTEAAAPRQTHLLLPAAMPGPMPGDADATNMKCKNGILILADRIDSSAAAAGLHLSSHVRLWEQMAALLDIQGIHMDKEDADALLAAAEKKVAVKLTDSDARQGLIDRVRTRLKPGRFVADTLQLLDEAGIDYRVAGLGWTRDGPRGDRWIGPTRYSDVPSAALDDIGACVALNSSPAAVWDFLDRLAVGALGFVPMRSELLAPDRLGAVLDPEQHVIPFDSPTQLTDRLTRFHSDPASFATIAGAAAAHLRSRHTWAHRVTDLLG